MSNSPRALVALAALIAFTGATGCSKTDSTIHTDSTTVTPPAAAPAGPERFGATMDGLSERPTTINTGATGTADFTMNTDGSIGYTINVTGLSSNPTGAHIHGPADANATAGPIFPFDSVAQTMSGTLATGTIGASNMQGITVDSLKALMRNGMAYVNIHTANHKDGEIRGQITKR